MVISNIFLCYILFLVIVIYGSVYLYKYDQKLYLYIVQVITIVSTVTIMFSLVVNTSAQYKIESQDSIADYGTNINLFLNDVMSLFLRYPQMFYMYREMTGRPTQKYVLRHKDHEIIIGCYIFTNCGKVVAYINESKITKDTDRIKSCLVKVLSTYLKSPILLNIWKTEYKPKMAGPLLIKFMDETFSL